MKYTRRNFFKKSGFTAVGLLSLASSPNLIFGESISNSFETDALYGQSYESFRNLIGTKFTIYGEDFAFSAELENVKDFSVKSVKNNLRKNAFRNRGTECFSLIFLLSSDDLPQDVYQVFHPAIGQFDLLLVPSANLKGNPTFTATINRI